MILVNSCCLSNNSSVSRSSAVLSVWWFSVSEMELNSGCDIGCRCASVACLCNEGFDRKGDGDELTLEGLCM